MDKIFFQAMIGLQSVVEELMRKEEKPFEKSIITRVEKAIDKMASMNTEITELKRDRSLLIDSIMQIVMSYEPKECESVVHEGYLYVKADDVTKKIGECLENIKQLTNFTQSTDI